MKAVAFRRYGGADVLVYTDVPDPKLSQNGEPVRVRTATLIRRTIKGRREPRL